MQRKWLSVLIREIVVINLFMQRRQFILPEVCGKMCVNMHSLKRRFPLELGEMNREVFFNAAMFFLSTHNSLKNTTGIGLFFESGCVVVS